MASFGIGEGLSVFGIGASAGHPAFEAVEEGLKQQKLTFAVAEFKTEAAARTASEGLLRWANDHEESGLNSCQWLGLALLVWMETERRDPILRELEQSGGEITDLSEEVLPASANPGSDSDGEG